MSSSGRRHARRPPVLWPNSRALVVKAKSETARIAAIRELLDRGYGRPRQAVEVSAPAGDPHPELFEEIDALNRKGFISRFRTNPLKPDLRQHQRRVGYFLREWSSEIDSLIAAARHIRGAVEAARFVAMGHLAPRRQAPSSRQLVE